MANRFFVGSGTNWSSTTSWASTTGGSSGASVPTAADDVFLDASSPGNLTIDTNAVCRSLNATGFIRTLTHAAGVVLTIGDGTAGASNVAMKFVAGMTYTLGSATTSTISFVSTSATQQTVDYGGKTGAAVTFNGAGGSWQLTGAINLTQTSGPLNIITLTAGSLDTNGQSITCSRILVTGSTTRSLSLGASTISIKSNGGGNVWDATTVTGLTFNAGTSSITASEANTTFVGGGLTYYNVTMSCNSGGSFSLTGNNTFNNFTTINSSSNTRLALAGNQIINGTFSATGLSATNTGLIYSSVRGTQRTLTVATLGTVNNISLQDIATAGTAGTWNLSTNNVGDGGGNTGITFPTGITHYLVTTATSNWNAAANWKTTSGGATTTARLPLAQDTVVVDANSFNATGRTFSINAQLVPTLDFRNVTNSPTIAFTITSGILLLKGSLYLPSTVTMSGTTAITFVGRSTDVLMTNGVTITNALSIESPGGSLTLQDDLTTSNTVTLTYGTFDANNHNVTIPSIASSNTNTRTITMGTGTWTLTGSNASIWDIGTTTTGLTINRGTPIICNYSGSVGTRTIISGDVGESSSPSFSITAGTDAVAITNSRVYNLDFTGFTGSLNNSARGIYGSLTYSSGMTLTAGTNPTTFYATSGIQTVTSNGQTQDFPATLTGVGGTVRLADNFTLGSTRSLTVTSGTFDANNFNVSVGLFASSNSNTRGLTMGTGTWTLTGVGTVLSTTTTTGLTLSATSATIAITDTSSSSKTLAFGPNSTYGNISITGGGTGAIIWQGGGNTFNNLTVTSGPKTITFTSGNTYTFTGTLTIKGTAGNLITLQSATAGSAHTLSKSSGVVYGDYLSIKDSTAAGGARWFAGANSTNVSNNTGWFFTIPNYTPVHTTDSNKRKATLASHTTGASLYRSRTHTTDALKVPHTGTTTDDYYTASSADDAQETLSTNAVSTTIQQAKISGAFDNGFRFPNVRIPQGSTITSAYIQVASSVAYVSDFTSGFAGVTVKGQAVDNAPQFSTATGNISGRATTTATGQDADPSTSGVWDTPTGGLNVTTIVQEIVNRGGWVQGNALALLFLGSGTETDSVTLYHWDYFSGNQFMRLHVTYTGNIAREMRTNHGTDTAIIKARGTTIHTTDANKKASQVRTHNTSSLKRKAASVVHTTDSNKKRSITAIHTTDSNKRKPNTKTHTTDARLSYKRSHTTDSNLYKTIIFSDTFTEATTNTDLPSHIPDTGTSWTDLWHTATTCKLTAIASSDTAKSAGSVTDSGVIYTADATYNQADYDVSAKIVAGFTGTDRGYLLIRLQDTSNMYALRFTTGGTATRMYKKVAGTWTALGSFKTDPAVGDIVKIRAIGTSLTWYINGTLQDTQTDSAISSAGKAGFAMGGGANLAASTDDILSTNEIDNFVVTNYNRPNAPTGLAGVESSSSVSLTWTDNSSDETSFVLERKRGGSPNYYQIAALASNVTSYSDTNVNPGYTYTYRIKAVNASAESTYNTSSSVTMTGTKKWVSHIEAWVYPDQLDAQTELTDGRVLYSVKPEYGTLSTTGVYSEPTGHVNGINDATMTANAVAYSVAPYFTVSAGAAAVAAIGADSTKQTNCINGIIATLNSTKFAGVELDWEGFGSWSATDYTNFKNFVTSLCTAVHNIGKKVIICGPPISNTTEQGFYQWKYEDFESSTVDFVEPLAYDNDFDNGAGTPIAPNTWVQNVCAWTRSKISNSARIIVGMPSYGYFGTTGGFSITNMTKTQAATKTGYATATRDSASYEMNWSNAGVSYFYNDTSGLNSKRELIEDEGIQYISVWHLGDNDWFSGKAEVDALITKTHSTSANKRKAFTPIHTTDSSKRKSITTVHTTDSFKKKAGLTLFHSTSSVKRKENILTHSTDTLKRATSTITHSTSSLIRKSATIVHSTDIVKRSLKTLVHTTSSLVRSGTLKYHTTDTYKRAGNVRVHLTDALLRSFITTYHTTDARRYLVAIPTWVSPVNFASNVLGTTPLVFIMPLATTNMHFHLQIDTVSTFDNVLQEFKSWEDQTNWEYWNGTAWVAVPIGGVDPSFAGNQARFTPSLTSGTYYRRVRGRVLL